MKSLETITLGGGCFWCVEAVFDDLQGVEDVVSGYMGGNTINPSYEDICRGNTGHAEVIQVKFDPAVISFRDILEVFFAVHNPTTLNRQGNDVGTQYRSAIFYHTPEQKQIAEQVIASVGGGKVWDDPIVTEVVPAVTFYPAEDYHQEFFKRNPHQGYCMAVVSPKVSKFRQKFSARLKS
ncbi:MAG: peptide-methionine (S)-S-oxide reductase MsrA [Betaproteobacteria bacterium]|nr:peptide-methionine (S)-S-oxide reductase MsrA [Betaproteobacteria bacterium]